MNEEYRDIPFYEDYQASNLGNIVRKKDGVILKQYPQKSGYVSVILNRGYGNTYIPVHRLVALAFHGTEGYEQGLFVDHIDTNRANNNADNLHWVTPKENSNNELTLKKRRNEYVKLD